MDLHNGQQIVKTIISQYVGFFKHRPLQSNLNSFNKDNVSIIISCKLRKLIF